MSRAGIGLRRTKIRTLVGGVPEYRRFYEGEGVDWVPHLQHF